MGDNGPISHDLFVIEVGLRTMEYFKYETNIDIELHFEDQIPFPAVTLCNQNAYRMTKAVELDLYYFLDDFYSAEDISGGYPVESSFL